MGINTRIYDRRKRQERNVAQARAELTKAKADLVNMVKVEAMKMAGDGSAKSRGNLPDEFVGAEFAELTPEQQISVLEDYVSQLRELGARLKKEYADLEGAQKELSTIEDRINAAGELIVKIELETIKPMV